MNTAIVALNEVHVWRIVLAQRADEVQRCNAVLSTDEIERADRYYLERERSHFTVARAAMRTILNLRFCYGRTASLNFLADWSNMGSNSRVPTLQVALLGVTTRLTVGVDIERIDPDFSTDDVAERFSSPTEAQVFRSPAPLRAEGFFPAGHGRKPTSRR